MVNYHLLERFKPGQLVTHIAAEQGSLEQLRQNLYVVHNRNLEQYVHDGTGSNWSTTSSQLVKIDATKFQLTITTNGGPVTAWFQGSARRATGTAYYSYYTIIREGDPVDNAEPNFPIWANTWKPVASFKHYPFLEAGTHTFAVYWQIFGGTVAVELQAASKPHFEVWEGY